MDRMPVYMYVTMDRYELPIAVADSIWELSRMLGVTISAVCKGLKANERGRPGHYRKVWIDLTPEERWEQRDRVLQARKRAGMA